MPDEIKRLPLLLQCEPTDTVVTVDGVPCRIWQGVDLLGGQYVLYVHRVCPLDDAADAALAAALIETPPPARMRREK